MAAWSLTVPLCPVVLTGVVDTPAMIIKLLLYQKNHDNIIMMLYPVSALLKGYLVKCSD
jgi:hypothetical protein